MKTNLALKTEAYNNTNKTFCGGGGGEGGGEEGGGKEEVEEGGGEGGRGKGEIEEGGGKGESYFVISLVEKWKTYTMIWEVLKTFCTNMVTKV